MAAMRIVWAFCLIVSIGVAGAPAQAQLSGENLLVTLPPGFKIGFQGSRNGMNIQEWVPANESVQNWSEMVTVQVFLRRTDIEPEKFLSVLSENWLKACKEARLNKIVSAQVNGYPMSSMMLQCPLLGITGKPETTLFRAIKGKDSFYLVQRAVRSVPSADQLSRIAQYLGAVTVCDVRSAQHPCPNLTKAQ